MSQGLQPMTPALRHSHGSAKQCKAADRPTTASDRLGTGSHSRNAAGSAAHTLTGLDALLVAGSTAAAQEVHALLTPLHWVSQVVSHMSTPDGTAYA